MVAGVLIRQHHGARDERAVGGGQFGLVHAPQRLGRGFGVELANCGGGDGDRTGLALDVHRVDAADGQRRACGVELIIVGDDQRVAAPDLVLQTNRPDVASLFLAPDVRAGELNVFAVRRHLYFEFLHALIHQTVTDRRAAADHAVADGDEVENIGHDARGELFAGDGKFQSGCSAVKARISSGRSGRRFTGISRRPASAAGLQPDAGRGGRADLRGFLRRAGHAQRCDADLRREKS